METFKKWTILVPELREHSLSYLGNKALFKYAQCSKLCNHEIQKCNTTAPRTAYLEELTNGHDGMVIRLEYDSWPRCNLFFAKIDERNYNLVRYREYLEKPEKYTILEGNAHEAALQYLAKRYKYVKIGKTKEIQLDCKNWQFQLEKVPAVYQAEKWIIKLYSSNYEKCMRALKENQNIKELEVRTDRGIPDEITLPSEFFKSKLFTQLDMGRFFLKSSIEDDDFLESRASYLLLNCDTITNNAINKKLQNWYDGEESNFWINFGTARMVNDVLSNLPFEQERNNEYRIRRPDGKIGTVYLSNRCVHF